MPTKKKPIPSLVQVGPKRAKSDETPQPVPSTSTSISPISLLNLEPKSQSHESSEATIIDTDKVENESGEKNIETELHSENVEQAEKLKMLKKLKTLKMLKILFCPKNL